MGLYQEKSKELESLKKQLKLNPDDKELYKLFYTTLDWIRKADRAIFEGKNKIGVNTGNYKSVFSYARKELFNMNYFPNFMERPEIPIDKDGNIINQNKDESK